MKLRRLTVTEIRRPHPISIVSPTDFVSTPGEEIEIGEVLADPRFSLYCLDPENEAALFVESGDPEAVDAAPFYYQAQAQHAVGLVSMPLESFHRTARDVPMPPNGLIFVHSVGRCGSTLMSKVLQAIPEVHSLSEPDELTQIARMRVTGERQDGWIRDVVESSVRWRCKTRAGKPIQYVAIKPRSEVMTLADLLGSSFADAKHLFMYRNGLAWMRTLFRGYPPERDVYDADQNREMERGWSRSLPLVRELRREDAPMNQVQIRMLAWVTCMEAYLALAGRTMSLKAVRFEDLTSNPLPVLERTLAFFEINHADWNEIRGVLSRDSQAGTIYDREARRKQTRELTDELVRDIHELIASRPSLGTPDVILPGTIRLDATAAGERPS